MSDPDPFDGVALVREALFDALVRAIASDNPYSNPHHLDAQLTAADTLAKHSAREGDQDLAAEFLVKTATEPTNKIAVQHKVRAARIVLERMQLEQDLKLLGAK